MDKQPISPNKRNIAAAAVTAALLGAFGLGAYCAAGTGGAFDPKGLVSSYGEGAVGASKGFRVNPTGQDGDANRHEDQSENDAKSAEEAAADASAAAQEEQATDAFSESGGARARTAYALTGSDDGTGVAAANGGTGASAAESDGSPVIVVPGGGDAANAGGGSGSAEKGGEAGKDDPAPTPSATENSYDLLPDDPAPSKDDSIDASIFPNKAGDGDSAKVEAASDDDLTVTIEQSYKQQLYYGQKLDAWTIFCSLSTVYSYTSPETGQTALYRWDCAKDEFGSYPYFGIVSWTDKAGDENPALCPEGDVTVTVRYRFSADGAWRERTVTCTPSASRVYMLGQANASGEATILGWTEVTPFNLLTIGSGQISIERGTEALGTSLTERALKDLGYVNDDESLNHLLLGWQESGKKLDHVYKVEPGRHAITPSGFAELAGGYVARLQHYPIQYDGEQTTSASTLQTLVDVDETVLEGDGEGGLSLTVPEGIEAVDDYRDEKGRATSWTLSRIELPSSVLYYNADGPFRVQGAYAVSRGNEVYAATDDGILTSKDHTSYLGIPAALTELDVPAGVRDVQVPQTNALDRVYVHSAAGEAPRLQAGNLSECVVVVDDDAFASFVEKNYTELAAAEANGVEVCRASEPSARYVCSGGMVYSEDELARVHDNGSDTVFVQIPATIKAGAFEGADGVTCVVLFNDEDCVLEAGSLAAGNVRTIVCLTERQAAGVKAQLAAAGAPDAHVILAQTSQEDMLYYVDGEKVTLLSDQGFASAFDGTVTDEEGDKLEVNAIAPYAFAGDTDLAWVTLGAGTVSVGAHAFQNCAGLQGLFLGAADEMYVGTGALEGCGSLGFVASLAADATFASTEAPNADCSWYCLPGATGYDGRFAYVEGYGSLCVEAQQDGSLVLYAAQDAGDDPQLVLAGGTSYDGTLVLPGSVVEIMADAFAGTGGTWDIDWTSAPELKWIDARAFKGSGFSGDAVIDSAGGSRESLTIGTGAFEGCADLASFTVDGPATEVGSTAFAGCASLERVEIRGSRAGSIGTGAFVSCGSLTSLELGGTVPAQLNLYSPGVGFFFTDGAENDERIALTVPEGSEQDYLNSWVYALIGYAGYDDYYSVVEWDILSETWEFPSEAEVRARMAGDLLEPENRLRRMMGMDEVDASTVIVNDAQVVEGFTYSAGEEGAFTLVSAPADATEVNLEEVLPEGCESLTIGAGAFAACGGLARIGLGEHVAAVESGAFSGQDGVVVALPAGAAEGISLRGGSAETPFDFGAAIVVEAVDGEQQAILAAWPMQCLGYADEYSLGDWVFELLWDFEDDPLAEAEDYINGRLLEQENYLRGLMGLDAIGSIDELAYRYSYDFGW